MADGSLWAHMVATEESEYPTPLVGSCFPGNTVWCEGTQRSGIVSHIDHDRAVFRVQWFEPDTYVGPCRHLLLVASNVAVWCEDCGAPLG